MNKLFLLVLLMCSISGYSQEANSSSINKTPVFNQIEFSVFEEVYVGFREVRPSLSVPVKQFPENQFSLKEISFDKKEQKRQVNLISMMERSRYEKEKALVELESPMPTLSAGEKALIEVTNEIRIHDRSSNYDIFTGQKKIPAYEEMRVPLFSSPYHSGSRARGYISPYPYSPFLR